MSRSLTSISTALTAGVVGALGSSAALLIADRYGLLQHFDTALRAAPSLTWLYPRMVWGGLWGVLLLVPLGPRNTFGRGLFWSLAPSLYQLLWRLPHQHAGLFGLALGQGTPFVVVGANLVWGLVAALWLWAARV